MLSLCLKCSSCVPPLLSCELHGSRAFSIASNTEEGLCVRVTLWVWHMAVHNVNGISGWSETGT